MKKLLRIILLWVPLGLLALSLLWVVALKWMPVRLTPLMVQRALEHRSDKDFHPRREWKNLDGISDNLVLAVMASEDTRFLSHDGFDRIEIKKALDEKKRGRRTRGASTISQQTAKNVFLLPSRTWLRKGLEAYFTVLIEKIWGKRRIMEVYLNVVEAGSGIYGAEAAARYYFDCPASRLTERQASLIAACLPNPLKRNPAHPTDYIGRRAGDIRSLMRKVPRPDWE